MLESSSQFDTGFCTSRRLAAFPTRAGTLLEGGTFPSELHLPLLLTPSQLQQPNHSCSALSSSLEVSKTWIRATYTTIYICVHLCLPFFVSCPLTSVRFCVVFSSPGEC